jgi:hypothetical protein
VQRKEREQRSGAKRARAEEQSRNKARAWLKGADTARENTRLRRARETHSSKREKAHTQAARQERGNHSTRVAIRA